MTFRVVCGDVADVLHSLEEESFDAVLCDPPYGLSFMGKAWDHGVPSREVWEAVARTLKPGAHLMAFGGDRTHHRLMVAIEDAGFEIRTCVYWMFGSGFPKSLNVGKKLAGSLPADVLCACGHDSSRKVQGSPVDCPDRHGSCDEPPLRASGIGQASSPSPADALGHIRGGPHSDGPGTGQADTFRPGEGKSRPSIAGSSLPSERHSGGFRSVGSTRSDMPESTSPVDLTESHRTETSRSRTSDSAFDSASSCHGVYPHIPRCGKCGGVDISGWNGYGTALKPAAEICILAMKPTCGTFAENAIRWGVAGLNVDGGRIGTTVETWPVSRSYGTDDSNNSWGTGSRGQKETQLTGPAPPGRFPANVILDEDAARALDEQSGEQRDGWAGGSDKPGVFHQGCEVSYQHPGFGGRGGASRFFYTAKASRREREAGLREAGLREARREEVTGRQEGSAGGNHARAGITARGTIRNTHPTVKPLALCEYLARLILPPKRDTPRRLLVPFSGSGSEMIGALLAGWDEVVGIEREAEYVAIAEARLAHWTKGAQMELSA